MVPSEKLKFQVVFSSLVVLVALLVTWITLAHSSPFSKYFEDSHFGDIWRLTVVVPFIFSAMISGNPHSPPSVIIGLALIIQWFVLGYLMSIPMAKLWGSLKKKKY